jgi:hypothetical protein
MKIIPLLALTLFAISTAKADTITSVQAQGSFLTDGPVLGQVLMTFQVSYALDSSEAVIPNSLEYATTGLGPFSYRAGNVSLIDARGDILDISPFTFSSDPYRVTLVYQLGVDLGSTPLFTDYLCTGDCSLTVTNLPTEAPESGTAWILVYGLPILLIGKRLH